MPDEVLPKVHYACAIFRTPGHEPSSPLRESTHPRRISRATPLHSMR